MSMAPDRSALHEAALAHLARYAATEAGLRRVLARRIDRWARAARAAPDADGAAIDEAARAAKTDAEDVARRLVEAGAVSDAAFAEARVRRLSRGGRSGRAIAAHLAERGVAADIRAAALTDIDGARELAAALALLRRRRIGPFRPGPAPDADGRRREAAILARAGFSGEVARRALAWCPDEAAGD